MWRSWPATRRVTVPALLILSRRTRSWVSVVGSLPWGGFGACCVCGRRGRSVLEGAVRAAVVVLVVEGVEEGLEFGDGGRLVGLGA